MINAATHTVIDTIDLNNGQSSGVAFSPDGSFAYVIHHFDGNVSVIDTATHAVIDTDLDTPAIDPIRVGVQAFRGGL